MNFGAIKDVLGTIDSQVSDRLNPTIVPQAGDFLQDWITTKLPEAVVGFATKVAGREDGSGMLANEAIKAGTDKHLVGSIFR